jgi:hypothetical protein
MHPLSILLFLFTVLPPWLMAQEKNELELGVGVIFTLSNANYQPFWVHSNTFGTIAVDNRSDLAGHIRFKNSHSILNLKNINQSTEEIEKEPVFVEYGLDIFTNHHFSHFFAKEAYIKIGYKNWGIRMGRNAEIIGELNPELSSGSLAVSGNALPLPKLSLSVNQFTDVPWTRSWLKFKGQYSHGWLGDSHIVKNAYLHEKVLYFQGGREKLKIHVGLSHFAQWGGVHPRGPIPSRFKDYLRVITGSPGDPEDPVYHQGPVDIANAVGNHLIVSDIGVKIPINRNTLKIYTQTMFSKGRGDSLNSNTRDELIGLNLFGKDRLLGVDWEREPGGLIQKVLIEGIYTKDQGGPAIFFGRYNYYNNATYTTGWANHGRIIGTPLFINREQAIIYNLDKERVQKDWNIVSNRIIGIHTGISGNLGKTLSHRFLFTHVRHFGNYYNDTLFGSGKGQFYILKELSYEWKEWVKITSSIGVDFGGMSNLIGGKLGVEWRMR